MTEKEQMSLPGTEWGGDGRSTSVDGERSPWEKPEVRALHAGLAENAVNIGSDLQTFS